MPHLKKLLETVLTGDTKTPKSVDELALVPGVIAAARNAVGT